MPRHNCRKVIADALLKPIRCYSKARGEITPHFDNRGCQNKLLNAAPKLVLARSHQRVEAGYVLIRLRR